MTRTCKALLLFALAAGVAGAGAPASPDEKELREQAKKIDKRMKSALRELAKKYEKQGAAEAAHFFAEAYVGLFGPADDTEMTAIRTTTELDVYLGKVPGGTVMKKPGSIKGKLRRPAGEYKKIVDSLVEAGLGNGISKGKKDILRECVVKYELAAYAHEFIPSIQRANELRKGMKLRPVLWDYKNSRRLILGTWYIAETGYMYNDNPEDNPGTADVTSEKTREFFWSEDADFTRSNSARGLETLGNWIERCRSYALSRKELLNPNARRIWIGHWVGSYFSRNMSTASYNIPNQAYRKDIATPTQKYARGTKVKGWVDSESTLKVNGKRFIHCHYPFDGEESVPPHFSDGKGAAEDHWAQDFDPARLRQGIPIMWRVFGQVTISDLKVMLVPEGGGSTSHVKYRDGDKRVLLKGWPTVLIVPKKHLRAFTSYTVTIECKVDETPVKVDWTFKTGKSVKK